MSKVITAASLRQIVRSAAGTSTPSVSKGKSIAANVQSSIARVNRAPRTVGTGLATNR